MSVTKTLGARFAKLRKGAGLTQEKLAERCGVTDQTIGRLERGDHLPSIERLAEIADALGVDLGDVIRPPPRDQPIDDVLASLTALLRRRGLADTKLVHDLAAKIFERYS